MNLSFKTTFPKEAGTLAGKPTHFPEKILKGLDPDLVESHYDKLNKWVYYKSDSPPKITTIRHDPNNRWKAGNDIHFWINARTKQQFQFAPVIPCVSTQEIEIIYNKKSIVIILDGNNAHIVMINDGGNLQYHRDTLTLVQNDGFDTIEDFFQYFNTDFKGTLIHWTDLKY